MCEFGFDCCTGWAEHVHHEIKLRNGGTHDLSNLKSTCSKCHHKYHADKK
ncbi:hypothetical protein FRUB_07018 [Fimbriiglobus ruber]|uniref:HNH domain-containing protein n=1 Tax=Fimbriiglobus ruber TaxID=1908690 RepID=A0A225DH73_9BACT|nr:hypothetical protein FRUB_07018 [Fimbriiglobus ruber]